jgi:hypothetical protein
LRAIEIIDGKAIFERTDNEKPEENPLIQSRDVKTSAFVKVSQIRLRKSSRLVVSIIASARASR